MFTRVRLRLGAASAAAVPRVTPAACAAIVALSLAAGKRGRSAPLPPSLTRRLAGVAGLRRRRPRAA
jgi:hypothetical protein